MTHELIPIQLIKVSFLPEGNLVADAVEFFTRLKNIHTGVDDDAILSSSFLASCADDGEKRLPMHWIGRYSPALLLFGGGNSL